MNSFVLKKLYRDYKTALVIGFAVLSIGVVRAYTNPATGYELSIYGSAPATFLVAVSVALSISAVVAYTATTKWQRQLGLVLGGLAMTAVVALPLIRGYQYIGENDAMTHLGWTRDINDGLVPMYELNYPVVHLFGSVLYDITGTEFPIALLTVLVVFVLAFFVFVPMTVRALTPDPIIVVTGAFSGLLLLPVNHFSAHMQIHTTSQAVMFVPVLLYLFVVNNKRTQWRFVLLFFIVGSTFTMLHPQQALNFVLFFGTIASVQILLSRSNRWSESPGTKFVFSSVAAFFIIFWLWTRGMSLVGEGTFQSVISGLLLQDLEPGGELGQRGASLVDIGGSYEEIFLKLFSTSFLYSVFTGLLMLAVILRQSTFLPGERLQRVLGSRDNQTKRLVFYLTIGLVPVIALFLIFIIANISDMAFRYYGFIMAVGTVIGAVAIGNGLRYSETKIGSTSLRKIAAVLFVCFLLIAVPVVHSSPYIYQATSHVSEQQMAGYETALVTGDGDISYTHVRSSASRYHDGIFGTEAESENFAGTTDGVPNHFANQTLPDNINETVYLGITEADRVRDPILWQGFRFSEDDFNYLETEPRIDKIQSNGEFDLYLVSER